MKILFLDQFSEMGGGQQCLRDVLIEVRKRGWRADLMAPGDGPLFAEARKLGCETRSLPLGNYTNGRKTIDDAMRFRRAIGECAAIVREAVRGGIDLVYVNGPRVLPAVTDISMPLLFHAHSVPDKWYASLASAWALRRSATRTIACSNFAAAPLDRWIRPDCLRVIYNGVPDHRYRAVRTQAGPIRIGMLGRIAAEKGCLDFVRAADRLKADSRLSFRIVGAALFSDSSYAQSIRTLGKEAGVEFHPWTECVADALRKIDIVVLPSARNDASPRVILDAFSAGVAVVAYPAGGIPELIQNGQNGLLTAQRSPDELAVLIRQLADDLVLRKRLVANGRRTWESRFQLRRFQTEVCDFIAGFVTSSQRGSSAIRFEPEEAMSSYDERSAAPANKR